ncbi:LOW QUALITY PROTEIN: hypothetical protein CRUP_005503 [Coryphaenoides rupestris]|nr:LOW QUALITY PROTEIN: hypothetical protein CRUP_005503 [Coryphaenoides rupestris]
MSTTPSESGFPVDRGTQTPSFPAHHATMHFPPLHGGAQPGPACSTPHHLFSHLPLHSQQPPARSAYSMVPVGGIQLVPAGLAGYSAFFPIQAAGPVQLTIPAVSVIHRNASPQPGGSVCSPPRREGGTPGCPQPLVVQEPLGSMMPCFPLGQVAGLQTQGINLNLGAGLGVGQGITLNATLGLQVLAATPTGPMSGGATTGPQSHLPGLADPQTCSLPAIISVAQARPSPLPAPAGSPEALAVGASPGKRRDASPSRPSTSTSISSSPLAPVSLSNSPEVPAASGLSRQAGPSENTELRTLTAESQRARWRGRPPPPPSSERPAGRADTSKTSPAGATDRGPTPSRPPPPPPPSPPPVSRHKMADAYDDYNDASSDDEDRLVIAT